MNICIIGASIVPGNMSAVTRSHLMAEGLGAINNNLVDLLIPRIFDNSEKIYSKNSEVKYFYNNTKKIKNINNGRYLGRLKLLFYVLGSLFKKKYNTMIFYSSGSFECLFYAILSKMFKIKFCTQFADPLTIKNDLFGKLQNHISYFIWSNCIKLSFKVIVISHGMKKLVKSLAPNCSTIIIPILINENIRSKNKKKFYISKKRNNIILYSGKLTKSSGVLDILKAAKLLKLNFGSWKIKISGLLVKNSSRHLDIPKLIEKMGLTEKIEFLGYLTFDKYKNLLNNSDILIVPKTSEKINSLNFPSKLGEFLITGKPVIVADTSDIKKYLKNKKDVLLYSPGDICNLIDRISYLIKFPRKAYAIGKNGKITAQKKFGNIINMKKLYFLVQKKI